MDGLHIHELGLELWLSILQEHFDDLAQVVYELLGVGALAMGARPAWYVPHQ